MENTDFLNVLNPGNYGTFNITFARIVGLETSAYCFALLSIYDKAKRKNKLIDTDYIKVDRKYIEQRTALSTDKQLEIDAQCEILNLIIKSKSSDNILKINVELIVRLIEGKDVQLAESAIYAKPLNKRDSRELKKAALVQRIKSDIVCDDPEIMIALQRYVDSAADLEPRKGVLSYEGFQIFQEEVTKFAKGNKNILIDIINTGATHKALDGRWAIRKYLNTLNYEKEIMDQSVQPGTIKATSISNKKF
jgi:hypothetical protein